ncbi:MAG: hypothetical protein JWO30_4117 [Fibrobacteres bacterium]|nr:hypothetical protein [Fibrobacterota bacterium]
MGGPVEFEFGAYSFKTARGEGATITVKGALHMGKASFISSIRKHGAKSALVLFAIVVAGREIPTLRNATGEEVAVWNNIGGCGSSGGGAAAGAGKWVGRGVSGGLVDLEILQNETIGGDYLYSAMASTFTFHSPSHPNYTLGLSMGLKHNEYEFEGYKAGEDLTSRQQRNTGGFADLGLSFNRIFGNENEHSVGLSVSLPTGQHDIKRFLLKGPVTGNTYDDIRWANPFVQPGSGLYNLGLSYEWTKTKDWGLLVFGGSYTAAFAWDNMGCRDEGPETKSVNDRVLSCQAASPSALTYKVWELKHQPWGDPNPDSWMDSYGAPGTGATGADGISMYGYIGHKEEASTQNVGLTFSAPLAPTYYWEYGPTPNERVSTRIRTNDYTLKLSAGLEITNPNFPIFLSVGLPYVLNDIVERGRLVDPQNYVATVGIKGTFF